MVSVELVSQCTESKTLVGSTKGSCGMRPRVAIAHDGVCRLLVSPRPSSRHVACARGASTPSSIHAPSLAPTRTKQHVRCIHFMRHRVHTRWTRQDLVQLDSFHSMVIHVQFAVGAVTMATTTAPAWALSRAFPNQWRADASHRRPVALWRKESWPCARRRSGTWTTVVAWAVLAAWVELLLRF